MGNPRYVIEYHYPKSDTECSGDYWHVYIINPLGEMIREYGDYYHDKGGEKAVAFLDGLQYGCDAVFEVVHKQIADLEDYGDA